MPNVHRRPVHLNLFLIRMPVPAVMSIAHRASGVLMVLLTPVLIYALQLSVSGAAGFERVQQWWSVGLMPLFLFLLAWALLHHLFAGLRYLALDLDIGVDKRVERATAWVVLVGSPVVALLLLLGAML
jgi:succinate dehydrogenase / fumarate reductase cytochrome b subunit